MNITTYIREYPDKCSQSFKLNAQRNHWVCPAPDADIAGVGVITSFLIAGLMTTLASITAAVLEAMISDNEGGFIFMPRFVHARLSSEMTQRELARCRFWRNILERLILNLADQQLITGISLLVIGYIVQPWPLSEKGRLWPARLSLVIYLSCLSSSSHLACMLSLHKYLRRHPVLAKLRMILIIIFALFLSISIGLGQTYYVLSIFYSWIFSSHQQGNGRDVSTSAGDIIMYVIPPMVALHVYLIAALQLMPSIRDSIKNAIRSLYRNRGRRLVPTRLLDRLLGPRWSDRVGQITKRIFWFCLFLNPPVIFAAQIMFAIISVTFILIQKFAVPPPSPPPPDFHADLFCSGLDNQSENQWGFGQMLAMSVLILPFLAALETYQEERSDYHKILAELNQLPMTTKVSVSHSRSTSSVGLMESLSPSPNASSFFLPKPDVGPSFSRMPTFRSTTSQYTLVAGADPDPGTYPVRDDESYDIVESGRLTPLQRSYHPDVV
ncbi:hypothetical protein AAFC00_000442 [Neodothiora populina]